MGIVVAHEVRRQDESLPDPPTTVEQLKAHANLVAMQGQHLVDYLKKDRALWIQGAELPERDVCWLARSAGHHGRLVLAALEIGRAQ